MHLSSYKYKENFYAKDRKLFTSHDRILDVKKLGYLEIVESFPLIGRLILKNTIRKTKDAKVQTGVKYYALWRSQYKFMYEI